MSSSIPAILFACLAVLMSFLRRYKPFKEWATSLLETSLSDYFLPSKQLVVKTPEFTISTTSKHFKDTKNCTLYELTQSLTQLQEYLVRAQQQNGIVFKRTKELDENLVDQLRKLNYFTKISRVNNCIEENYKVLESVIHHVLEKLIQSNIETPENDTLVDQLKTVCAELGYNLRDDNKLEASKEVLPITTSKSNQGRVNEALGHLCRDWSSSFQCERQPLNDFVRKRLEHTSISKVKRNLVIVPGAGVGHLPFFIAQTFPQFEIASIEWSSLMYILNEFTLDHHRNVKVRPFAQYYSSSINAESQMRSFDVELSNIRRPPNLKVHWGDFREYTVNDEQYDQIIVCTAFFMDTAENIFDYLEAIEQLKESCKQLHWINIGPLKYGTKPLVQLTADELKQLRGIRGWRDLVEERTTQYEDGLNGYLTDYQSLYQGYYGLLKFHSVFEKEAPI